MVASLFTVGANGGIYRTDLPPLTEAEEARDEAIDRVDKHADAEWKATALAMVIALATLRPEITTDDVWHSMERFTFTTHEPRAMGAIMRTAARKGYIEPTDEYRTSTRKECHARPVKVWRCKRYYP